MARAVWVKAVVGSVMLAAALTGCSPESGMESPADGAPPAGIPVSTSDETVTEQVSLVAVDAAGQPVNGFTVPEPAGSGSIHCTPGHSGSRSSTTGGIYQCGASAQAADVCWGTAGAVELFCANDPWKRELRKYTADAPLEQVAAEQTPEPWALELADGRQCRIRVGGAWGGRADGLVGAYSCTGESGEVVLQDRDSRTALDRSTPTWTVRMGELAADNREFPPPATVEVRKAYFAASA